MGLLTLLFLDYNLHIRRIRLGWIQRYRFVLLFLVPRDHLHMLNPYFTDLVRQLNLTGAHTQPYCALCLRPLRQRRFSQDTIVFAAHFGVRQRAIGVVHGEVLRAHVGVTLIGGVVVIEFLREAVERLLDCLLAGLRRKAKPVV